MFDDPQEKRGTYLNSVTGLPVSIAAYKSEKAAGVKFIFFPYFLGVIPIFSYLFKKTSYFPYFLVLGVQRMKIFV